MDIKLQIPTQETRLHLLNCFFYFLLIVVGSGERKAISSSSFPFVALV